MKTKLYRNTKTGKLLTLDEVKEEYIEENNSDLPIDDGTMELIVVQSLVKNGGHLTFVDNEVLAWCNEYAEMREADRYLSQEERDESIKIIYENIHRDKNYIKELEKSLSGDAEDKELIRKLESILNRG